MEALRPFSSRVLIEVKTLPSSLVRSKRKLAFLRHPGIGLGLVETYLSRPSTTVVAAVTLTQLSLLTEAFLAPQRPLQQTTGGEDRQQISSRPRQCREPNQKPRSQCSRPRHRQRRHLQRPLSSRYRRPRRCKGTCRRGWVWTAIPLPGHAPTLAEEPGSQVRGDWKLIGQYWRYGSASDSRHSVWNQQGRSTLDRPKDPL